MSNECFTQHGSYMASQLESVYGMVKHTVVFLILFTYNISTNDKKLEFVFAAPVITCTKRTIVPAAGCARKVLPMVLSPSSGRSRRAHTPFATRLLNHRIMIQRFWKRDNKVQDFSFLNRKRYIKLSQNIRENFLKSARTPSYFLFDHPFDPH